VPTDHVREAVARLRRHTALPIAVGFGIRTPEQAGAVSGIADAAVVGSALVDAVKAELDDQGRAKPGLAAKVLALVDSLASGVRGSRAA
jgi:tryptophan synthase alpha chain